MAVDRYIKRGGAWVSPPSIYTKRQGAWIIPQLYTKRAGVWVNFDAVVPPAPPPPPPALSATGGGTVSGTITGSGSVTSSTATMTAVGGVSPYSYAWTYTSGDAVIINSPTSASSTFTKTLTAGTSSSTVVRGRITDSASQTADISVTVALSAALVGLAASATPDSLSATISGAGYATTSNTSVSVSGGTGSYNYSWAKLSGDTINVSNASGAITSFNATLTNGQTTNSVYRCTVADTGGQTTYVDVTISLTSAYVAPFSAGVNPTELVAYISGHHLVTTGYVGAYPTGGTSPYSYSWTIDSPSVIITAPTSASTRFQSAVEQTAFGTVTITDATGQTAQAVVTVDFREI